MTIIEFFDKSSVENIAGALLCRPERIIFIGDSRGSMERSRRVYGAILESRNINTSIELRFTSRNNLAAIEEMLENIVQSYTDCIFDLTGGEDLYLVAVGMIMNKYSGRVQCHRFNFRNNVLYDCDADGNVCSAAPFCFSVKETIEMNGGRLITDEKEELYTYPWDFTDEFTSDIRLMWEINKKNPGQWNGQIGTLGGLIKLFGNVDTLSVSVDRGVAEAALYEKGIKYKYYPWIINHLSDFGLIESASSYDRIEITFKNKQVMQALSIEGQVLELFLALMLRLVVDKDGGPMYQDITVGAVVDWDIDDLGQEYKTINEIDIIAMKDAIPVFISCKNGYFDASELYKLATVSRRFGGKYATRALACTRLGKTEAKNEYLRARMKDMNIRCVDDLCFATDEELLSLLKNLWMN